MYVLPTVQLYNVLHKIFHIVMDVHLTFILLTWRIWCAPSNASKWQMGFNLAFKGLMCPSVRKMKQMTILFY